MIVACHQCPQSPPVYWAGRCILICRPSCTSVWNRPHGLFLLAQPDYGPFSFCHSLHFSSTTTTTTIIITSTGCSRLIFPLDNGFLGPSRWGTPGTEHKTQEHRPARLVYSCVRRPPTGRSVSSLHSFININYSCLSTREYTSWNILEGGGRN